MGVDRVQGDTRKEAIRQSHERQHLGVTRTLYLAAKELGMGVSRAAVEEVIRDCDPCQQIDPSSVKWKKGRAGVETN